MKTVTKNTTGIAAPLCLYFNSKSREKTGNFLLPRLRISSDLCKKAYPIITLIDLSLKGRLGN